MTAGHAHEHERAHITDSRFHGHMYATDASRRIFCDICRLQRWLDVEAALALSQAEVGALSPEIAATIAGAATVEQLDLERVARETRNAGHSLIALIRSLQEACGDPAGQFVHYGATTQDIQDTAQSLEMRDVLDQVDGLADAMVPLLTDLADHHASTVMTGRTHGQPALPITFGLKVSSWIDELLRARERVGQARSRVLAAQLYGGVGSMAAFGTTGPKLVASFAARLGLEAPLAGWHASRDRVAEYVSTMAICAATVARVADEIRTLARPELGELTLGWRYGKVGSSTMPHKRNPEECEQVVVLARLAAAQVPLSLQAMIVEHERDSRELRTEWASVADVSHYTLAAMTITLGVLSSLDVNAVRMAANADRVAGDLATERLMLELAPQIGKQSAYALVYEAAQAAAENGRSLRQELLMSEAASGCLTAEAIDAAFRPEDYVGLAPSLTRAVVAHARRSGDNPPAGGG